MNPPHERLTRTMSRWRSGRAGRSTSTKPTSSAPPHRCPLGLSAKTSAKVLRKCWVEWWRC